MSGPQFILASASPRRRMLLEQLGLKFKVRASEVDELPEPGEAPGDYVLRVSRLKAEAVARQLGVSLPVLSADTEVVLDGSVLGKPKDRADALKMLSRLSGRAHQVLSGVALWKGGALDTARCESRVSFRALEAGEAEAYWESGEPRDKAGAYGIQGRGAVFVERLEGSYSNVVGLPLFETATLLRRAGVKIL